MGQQGLDVSTTLFTATPTTHTFTHTARTLDIIRPVQNFPILFPFLKKKVAANYTLSLHKHSQCHKPSWLMPVLEIVKNLKVIVLIFG